MNKLPELLAPAGSSESLHAAIEAGADAVYFGGELYSNRMRAKNFTSEELIGAIRLCNTFGVSSYITMNTRLRDRELPSALAAAGELYDAGATAFIVADLGLASSLRESLPAVELHASTQMTGIGSLDAKALSSLGFSRMVCPRELSREELFELIKNSPIDIEMFIHGAHCVSVSGQCLMSWAMGGRSGNRGECAQPCRLPYKVSSARSGKISSHPLSLKDMCLARHIPEIIGSGVASLKIEGRLKSADYVYGVTKIYRSLLDDRRAATDEEVALLDGIFSRGGFTDGYFRKKYFSMTGMRSEDATSSGERFTSLTRKIPLRAKLVLEPLKPAGLILSDGDVSAHVLGDTVQEAKSAPVKIDSLYKNISKLGGTPYSLAEEDFGCSISGNVFLAASQVNSLRRYAVEKMVEEKIKKYSRSDRRSPAEQVLPKISVERIKTAEFANKTSVPDVAYEYFDIVFLSDTDGVPYPEKAGLALSPWCSDDTVRTSLGFFAKTGGKHVLCHTLGQIKCAIDEGLTPTASLRLNLTCAKAADTLAEMGVRRLILSPELNSAAVRDIAKAVPICGAVVYGKLPLMLLRKCLMIDSGCSRRCGGEGCLLPTWLSDRKGARFSVLPTGHMTNLIVNSVPLYTADSIQKFGNISTEHFIFTDESPAETENIIFAYRNGLSPEEAGLDRIKRV